VFEYRDDDKPSTMAPTPPAAPPVERVLPSATGSGATVVHQGRVPAIDGHQPAVVGGSVRIVGDPAVSYPYGEDMTPVLDVQHVPAPGAPARWSSGLPTWADQWQSNVRKGRNKKGQTQKVQRHGRLLVDWDIPEQDMRLAGYDVLRIADRDAGQVATEWVRTNCLACIGTREACDDQQHEDGATFCRACQQGCGCMPDPEPMTIQRADVTDGPLSIDRAAPAPAPVERYSRAGKRRDGTTFKAGDVKRTTISRQQKRAQWVAECQERADSGWSAHCRVAVAHASLGDALSSVSTHAAADLSERFGNASADVRKSLAHGVDLAWRGTVAVRGNRLGTDKLRAAAGVEILNPEAVENGAAMILGRREGMTTSLVGWAERDRGYWIGHRFVTTQSRRIRIARKRSASEALASTQRAQEQQYQAQRDHMLETILSTLSAMAVGDTESVAGQPVKRTAPGRWLIGTSALPKSRAVARLMLTQ